MDYTYDDSREEEGVTVGKEKEKKKKSINSNMHN